LQLKVRIAVSTCFN